MDDSAERMQRVLVIARERERMKGKQVKRCDVMQEQKGGGGGVETGKRKGNVRMLNAERRVT